MVNLKETAPFGEKRSYGLHEGRDVIGDFGKATPIENLYDGLLQRLYTKDLQDKNYGIKVCMAVNPKYIGGVDANVLVEYCHLHSLTPYTLQVDKSSGAARFIKKDTVLGYMGNTGNCMTADGKGGWRTISKEEQSNPSFLGGVHLHYQVRVVCKEEAKLLMLVMKEKKIKAKTLCFEQWGGTYFDPVAFDTYMNSLRR